MTHLISIETTRYSEFFRRLFAEYADGITIEIGRRRYSSSEIPDLLADWCTNAEICRTKHFRLLRGGVELVSFHDHPRELCAALSERAFVEKLQADHILRFRVLPVRNHEACQLFSWLRRWFAA